MDTSFLSDAFGYLSILCWLGAQFPQVIVNLRTKSVEGLALPFLANWLFGDITNLVGCILTHQLPFQTYLATYFVFVDLSLVGQYIWYYKPPPPYTPIVSPSPSPTSTLTPTALVYSSRNITRPHSRSRLLERSISEIEAGYRTYDEGKRRASSRFSGVMSSYPPAGLLPTSEQIASGSETVKLHRADKRPSVASLRARMEKKKQPSRAREGSELSTEERDEDEDEVSALADSFYSEASGPVTVGGRHVSWGRATGHPRHPSNLTQTSSSNPVVDSPAGGSGEVGEGDSTPTQALSHSQEEIRQRSRSRGRPSTRSVLPIMTYDFASPMNPASPSRPNRDGLQPLTSTTDVDVEVERHIQRHGSQSKSGSRRRSASIVFLGVGLGAFLTFGGGSSLASSSLRSYHKVETKGEVLGWTNPSFTKDSAEDRGTDWVFFKHEKTDNERHRRPHESPPLTPEQKRRIVGRISAWACTTLYLTSRLPQIWKNYTRKSVQGLSLALFVFAFLGNTFYVASILTTPILWTYPPDSQPSNASITTIHPSTFEPMSISSNSLPPTIFDSPVPPYQTPRARAFLRESLPYLLGSAGTLCFDVVIVTQGIIYGRRERLEEEVDSDDEEEEEEGDEGSMEERREEIEERSEAERHGEDGRLLERRRRSQLGNDGG